MDINIKIRKLILYNDAYNRHCKVCDKVINKKGYDVIGKENVTIRTTNPFSIKPDKTHYFQVHYGMVCSKKCATTVVLQNI